MTLSHRFVLVGPHEGATVNYGGHQFVDGVYEFLNMVDGQASMPSQDDIKLKARALARGYQAFPEGSLELKDAQERFEKGQRLNAEASTPGEREDKEQAERADKVVTERQTKGALRDAITKLDPENDDHWTDSGLPAVAALREIAGVDTIARADIAALAPNLTREEAKKIAAENANA